MNTNETEANRREIPPMSAFSLFPECELPLLSKPPIELIIAQVRFPMVIELLETSGIAEYASAVKADYPHVRPVERLALRLSTNESPSAQRGHHWRLEDKTQAWTLTVSPDFLALEVMDYHTFDEFRDRFCNAVGLFADVFDPPFRTRLGLRYVDRASKDKYPSLPDAWLDQVRAQIFPLRAMAKGCEQRAEIKHRIALSTGLAMTYRAELYEHDPSSDTANEFKLDIDCYDITEGPVREISAKLDELKALAYSAFTWSFAGLLKNLE